MTMTMQTLLIQQLVNVLIMSLSTEVLKKGLDGLLDLAEESVMKSENMLDDAVVLGLCQQIRRAFDVPDND